MATATAPPAPPGVPEQSAAPAGPAAAAAPAAASGPLARILTPVEPARPVKPLGSTATMGEVGEETSTKGGSSKDGAAKNGGRQEGAVAALVRALASRIGRTGTTTRRTHTVTEARVTGNTKTATSASKSDRQHRHDGKNHSNRDSKLADLRNKTQQGKTNHDRKAATDAKTSNARTAKADTAARTSRDGKTADTKAATTVTASKPDGRSPSGGRTAKGADAKAAGPTGEKPSGAAKTLDPAKPAAAARPAAAGPSGKPGPAVKADPKGLNAKTAAAPRRAGTAPVDLTKDTSAPTKPSPAATTEPAAAAPKLRTRPAREAGYRDGTRVAAVTGQARAYKDGVVDGWDDRTAADKAEQRRMDDVRARNAIKPKEAPTMKPASGSTIDLEKKTAPVPAAVPAQVTAVGGKAVEFVADGAARTMSRGEVRTLKAFERRIAGKRTVLGRLAERSKTTRSNATDLATRARGLAEDAKSIQGGPLLVGRLHKLAERAQVLRTRAEEIEKAAHRAAESVVVLAANAETRHGGIYKAVVDSPLTAPAEREFYQDNEGG